MVIVVIGVLVAISVVTYNNVQDKARTSVTELDISNIKKAHNVSLVRGNITGLVTSLEDVRLESLSHKIVLADSDDPGFGPPKTYTPRGQYHVYIWGDYLNIYFWNYTEKVWQRFESYDEEEHTSYARGGAIGSSGCTAENVEACGQQGEY